MPKNKTTQYEVLVRFPEEIVAGEEFITTVHDHGNTYPLQKAKRILEVAKKMPMYKGCDFKIVSDRL